MTAARLQYRLEDMDIKSALGKRNSIHVRVVLSSQHTELYSPMNGSRNKRTEVRRTLNSARITGVRHDGNGQELGNFGFTPWAGSIGFGRILCWIFHELGWVK